MLNTQEIPVIFIKNTFMQKLVLIASSILFFGNAISQTLTPGINLSSLDSSVSPRNDIYKFANGKWLSTQKIPASDGSWGSFNEINERNVANLKSLMTYVSNDVKALSGTNNQKLRDFYLTAMDSAKADREGIKPISADLAAIDAVKTKEDLLKTTALLNKKNVGGMIGFYIYSDFKNSNANTCYLAQTGMGLPDKDFYFEPQYESVKKEYVEHIVRMFDCLSNSVESGKNKAEIIIKIETELAKNSQNAVEQRDPQKQYNPFTKEELMKLTPNLNWDIYFSAVGINTPDNIVLNQPKFYEGLNTIINSVSIADWKVFLKWNLIQTAAPYLSSKFVNESF